MPPLFATYVAKALSGRATIYSIAFAVIESVVRVFPFTVARLFLSISRLRARPKGAALWNPAAFEKAGEAFTGVARSIFNP